MKKLLLIFGGIAGFSALHGQTLSPEVVASAGTKLSGSSISTEFTIGEVLTSTLTANNNVLTQGFHQPNIVIVGIDPWVDTYSFSVYPNPSDQYVTIETNDDHALQARIYNDLGQLVLESSDFTHTLTLNMEAIANGPYLLQVTRVNGEPVKNFTLVKRSTH
jgi:hypothetical protein